jgi:hypothetical protein
MITAVYLVTSIDRAGTRIATQITEDETEARDTARMIVDEGAYPRADVTLWRLGGSWFIAENIASFERETGPQFAPGDRVTYANNTEVSPVGTVAEREEDDLAETPRYVVEWDTGGAEVISQALLMPLGGEGGTP